MMVVIMVAMMVDDYDYGNDDVVDVFVVQVWLNINWFWVGGGLFPITW